VSSAVSGAGTGPDPQEIGERAYHALAHTINPSLADPCATCGHERGDHSPAGGCLHRDEPDRDHPTGRPDCTCTWYEQPEPVSPIEHEDFAICELCDSEAERFAVSWGPTGLTDDTFTAMAEHLALRHTHLVLQVNVRDEAVSFTIGDDD
jgi:hypothetical protein